MRAREDWTTSDPKRKWALRFPQRGSDALNLPSLQHRKTPLIGSLLAELAATDQPRSSGGFIRVLLSK